MSVLTAELTLPTCSGFKGWRTVCSLTLVMRDSALDWLLSSVLFKYTFFSLRAFAPGRDSISGFDLNTPANNTLAICNVVALFYSSTLQESTNSSRELSSTTCADCSLESKKCNTSGLSVRIKTCTILT